MDPPPPYSDAVAAHSTQQPQCKNLRPQHQCQQQRTSTPRDQRHRSVIAGPATIVVLPNQIRPGIDADVYAPDANVTYKFFKIFGLALVMIASGVILVNVITLIAK